MKQSLQATNFIPTRGTFVPLVIIFHQVMNKNRLVFLAFVFFFSCTQSNPNELPLFNGLKFLLFKGEQIKLVKSKKDKEFESYFNIAPRQIPLYKFINARGYKIYIGIPYNTSLKRIIEYRENQKIEFTKKESDLNTYLFSKFNDNDGYVTEYFTEYDNSSIYILTISKSSQLSDSLFNQNSLMKRLIK